MWRRESIDIFRPSTRLSIVQHEKSSLYDDCDRSWSVSRSCRTQDMPVHISLKLSMSLI
jgi:hypothetical protein